jgi:transposase-like protein
MSTAAASARPAPQPAPQAFGRLDLPEGFSFAGALEGAPLEPSRRADGWTPDRQRAFLAALAEGATVEAAARDVGLSPQSAYAFRQRAAGAVFALGWHAALLLQRQKLADALTSRALDGQVDTYTRADGSTVQRHRHDNRLGLALLTRLDRLAAVDESADCHGEAQAARLVAGEWQRYLDLVAADASPAQAGLFLAARAPAAPANDVDPLAALAPVVALARADLYCRARVGAADEVDTADLDPAHRAQWTAGQWARAEAAGLIALAPNPQLPQHSPDPAPPADDEEEDVDDAPVWFDEDAYEWRTRFPAPAGFFPYEEGRYGDDGYVRALTAEEEAIVAPAHEQARAEHARAAEQVRAAWFAARTPVAAGDTAAEDEEQAIAIFATPFAFAGPAQDEGQPRCPAS